MEKSYLVELIKTMQPEELQQFALFLASPFFAQGAVAKESQALFTIIIDTAPGFSEPNLKKDKVYQLMFPGKPLVEGKLKKVMSELNKLLRTYFLVRHYLRDSNDFQQQLDMAQVLRLRGMSSRHQQAVDKLKSQSKQKTGESVALFQQEYLLENEIHDWASAYNQGKGDINIPSVLYNLEMHYFANRLELLNRFLLQQKVTQIETPQVISVGLEDSHIPSFYLERSVLLMITDKIHRLLQQPQASFQEFQELLTLLQQNENSLEPQTLVQFYTYLRNFCVLLIDSGAEELILVLHRIQQDNLKRGYFYHEGMISPNAYLNINHVAIKANDLEWALDFTVSHKDRIVSGSSPEEFYHLNLAICLFAQNKLEEALAVIPFGSSYSFYHLIARRLELKIYYEMASDLLPYKIDAFKMFISRASHKFLSDNLRELHTNFVNTLHQLSLSPKRDSKRAEQLIQRISGKKLIAERQWLVEKAKELA